MTNLPTLTNLQYLRLGTGDTRWRPIGNKGKLLDKAAKAGLPVPRGVILLDKAYQGALKRRLVVVKRDKVRVPDAAALAEFLSLPRYTNLVAVRSAFSVEDRRRESLAGFFHSELFVDSSSAEEMADALEKVWSSALRHHGDFRRDVIVMEMVNPVITGIAFTETEYEDDLVNYTQGSAEDLVAGRVAGKAIYLPKLRFREKPGLAFRFGWEGRLQQLLRDVRRKFGARRDWDIEWADNGERCYLLQVRPVTWPTRRNEAFSIANHKEVLPDLPSRFMTDVVISCSEELFNYYRKFDRRLPATRPLIEGFYGRPYLNLSLLTSMMRRFGLPTRLVTGSIGGETIGESGFNLRRMMDKFWVLLRFGLAHLSAPLTARRTMQQMLERTEHPGSSFTATTRTLQWLYINMASQVFRLVGAMSLPVAWLREWGVLEEHNARQGPIASTMADDLNRLRETVVRQAALKASLEQGELPDDTEFLAAWGAFIEKHGHRGVYESDIARPRFREAPEQLMANLLQTPRPNPKAPRRTLKGLLTLPLWWMVAPAMQARERLRDHAMIGWWRVRLQMLALAERAVARGQLPSVEAVWMLQVDELHQLDKGWRPHPEFFARRELEIERLQEYQLPDLFYRFDDLELYRQRKDGLSSSPGKKRLRGISLTRGEAVGRAWVLDEPAMRLPDGFSPEDTILIARSVDAGWIPTFACVSGVVVETGGDLSHGSIILREIGLPAITNVSQVRQVIKTGDKLRLDATSGTVESLQDEAIRDS